MPYKKRQYKRKRVQRSKYGFLKSAARAGLALAAPSAGVLALRMARRLKDMVNTEYKFYDVNNASSPDYTGSLSTLNTPSQGQTDITRIGDSIKVQNLVIRGSIAVGGAANSLRMMILWDSQAKSSVTSDVLQYVGSVYAPFSPKNYDKRFQTKILHDKVYTLVPNSDSALRIFDLVIPIDQHTQFEGGTSTINTGALKILLISATTVPSAPSVTYQARISYTDN